MCIQRTAGVDRDGGGTAIVHSTPLTTAMLTPVYTSVVLLICVAGSCAQGGHPAARALP
jgi:hypothetical protein